MKIVKAQEGTEQEFIKVQEIQGDMGESERMQLLQQPDGDVIVTLYDVEKGQIGSIEFCTSNGGGRYPVIAKKLRELIAELVKLDASPWPNTAEITTVPAEDILPEKMTAELIQGEPPMSVERTPGEPPVVKLPAFTPGSKFHLYKVDETEEKHSK